MSSMYPNIAISNRIYPQHLGETFCDIYQDMYEQRKSYPKGSAENAMLKLALNGTYGKSNDKYSIFYDPKFTMQITINGQLSLCLLAEKLLSIPDLKIIQVNTDGITVALPRVYKEVYDSICSEWQEQVKLQLEFADYSKMIIRDVNNYIAVREDGKIKEKGIFETKKEWHKDNSYMVVPIAVREYFVNNIPVEETIHKHENILDFCGRYKATKGWHVEFIYLDGDKEKRLNFGKIYRFLPVNRGGTSWKINKDGREHQLLEGYQTFPYNQKSEFDRKDLNYGFFVNEAQKLIQTIKPLQMTLL